MNDLKSQVRVVLVNPSHPGNVGAVARALKTMGLRKLYLVDPQSFPHHEADARASGAVDVLRDVVVTSTLNEAIADCELVLGCSARDRAIQQPTLNVRKAAKKIIHEVAEGLRVALLFGRERIGLENKELMLCHYQIRIPTDSSYRSLNLAAAVQILAYELHMAVAKEDLIMIANKSKADRLATTGELEGLYNHIEEVMIKLGFLDPNNPRGMMSRLRNLINRSRIDRDDLDLLRGMMKAVQRKIKPPEILD